MSEEIQPSCDRLAICQARRIRLAVSAAKRRKRPGAAKPQNGTGTADRKITDRKTGFLFIFMSSCLPAPANSLAVCEQLRLLQNKEKEINIQR
jgi:hypothetical protein